MEDQFYADTARLAGHAGIVREERNLAIALRDKLTYLQSFYLPGDDQEMKALTEKASQLVRHFSDTANLIENMSWDFQRLSNEISLILRENESIASRLIQ